MHTRRRHPRASRLLVFLPLALALASCQDSESLTGAAPVEPRFTNILANQQPGTLVSWGLDLWGEVSQTPAGNDFVAVAGGGFFSVALRADGSLVAWGLDDFGQISQTPAGNDFVAVASGFAHSLALRADGSLVSWGLDYYGQVSQTPIGNDFVAVAGAGFFSVALRADGSLVAWGEDGTGQVSQTPIGNGFAAVAAGFYHNVALRTDGSLVSWGYDEDGQVAQTPAGNDFVAVAAGDYFSVALRADGSLVAWGSDDQFPVSQAPTGSFAAVSAGWVHGLALRADGSLASWGFDGYGQVSDTPTGNDFVAISAGRMHSVGIQAPAPPPPPPPTCTGAEIRMTRTSGPAVVSPGEFASWTATIEVTACQFVTSLSAQGGQVAWATTHATTTDGQITVRNQNRINAVLLWEIGSIKAGSTVTATLHINGTIGRKAVCGSDIPIASDWSVTADAGAGPIKYGVAGPLTVRVGC